MEMPVLSNYLSATGFLQDLYAFHKIHTPGFSYDSWATELGLKSRSFLQMIIKGERKITEPFIETLAHSLKWNDVEKEYFSLITNFNQSEKLIEKNFYLDQIFEHAGRHKEVSEILHYSEFLSSTAIPKLFVLLSFTDLDRSPEGLATFLKTTPEIILTDLQKLEKLGLAFSTSQGWRSIQKSFKVPRNLGCPTLENYHNQSLLEAIAAQRMPLELRRFRSILLPLSTPQYEQLLSEFDSMFTKILAKYDSDTLSEKRLYKINLNLFPLTELSEESKHNLPQENEKCSQV